MEEEAEYVVIKFIWWVYWSEKKEVSKYLKFKLVFYCLSGIGCELDTCTVGVFAHSIYIILKRRKFRINFKN